MSNEMSRLGRLFAVLLVAMIGLAASRLVMAQQGGGDASANMQVTANVIRKCTISAQPMNFGNYDPVQANATAPLDGQAVITVACTKGTTVNLSMDGGSNEQGQTRRMSGGPATFLQYEVYKDASRTEVWGETGNQVYDGGVAPSRDPRQFIAYGRVPGGQDVPEGTFQDTVLVTVDF
jgi:spore coat protein U-like protein